MIATLAVAAACAVPYHMSMRYSHGELHVRTAWRSQRVHRVTSAIKVYVNGRLVVDDVAREWVGRTYWREAIIGTARPRTVRVVVAIKSRDCTRRIHGTAVAQVRGR